MLASSSHKSEPPFFLFPPACDFFCLFVLEIGSHYVAQVGPRIMVVPLPLASCMLGWQVCATMSSSSFPSLF